MGRHLKTLIVILVVAAVAWPTVAVASGAIAVNPNSGPPGSTVTVSGSGFRPGEPVQIGWDPGQPDQRQLGNTQVGANGAFNQQVTVPADAARGGHVVQAFGASSGPSNQAPFQVTASRSPTPAPKATASPTPRATVSPGSPSPSPQASPSPHIGVNPIKDPWPKLPKSVSQQISGYINGAKQAQGLAMLVSWMKTQCCNFNTMAGGMPTYDPNIAYDGSTEREKGGQVRLGRHAFTRGVSYLYSTLKHEMVHSQQWQDPAAAEAQGSNARERQAYQRELDNAANTGLDAAGQKTARDLMATYK